MESGTDEDKETPGVSAVVGTLDSRNLALAGEGRAEDLAEGNDVALGTRP